MLTPDRWRRVEALFDEALARPEADRPAFVAARCAGEPELQREIESLLAADAGPDAGAALIGDAASDWAAGDDRGSLVGRDIDGYRVISLLGAGGMGEVYVARELALRRQVALKLLPEALNTDDRRVRLFADEALAASALNHPNIVTVYRIGTFEGRQYIATELVDGDTLRARIDAGPIAAGEALGIAVQIAGALGQAHDAGIVHRDIKPENVVIRFDGLVKVIDFGLAKLEAIDPLAAGGERGSARASRSRAGAGTIDYMAPEQAAGGVVDERADLYSLSVVLYEMLTGTLPRELGGAAAPVQPEPLLAVVRRGLSSDPALRHQTAGELRRDLESIQRSLDLAPDRARGRHTRIGATIVLTVAALAALAFGAASYVSERRSAAPDTTIRSLVVLPFTSIGAAADQRHLELGMADAVITRLAALPGLTVPPTAAIRAGEDPFEAARRLNVDGVLTGSIQRADGRIRIVAQLSLARDRTQIWAQRFDAPFTDIFEVQDTLAERIATNLVRDSAARDGAALTRRETPSAEAYDLYLRGREQWSRRTAASIRTAVQMFEAAIALDPNFALAYTGLADCYNLTASGLPPADRFPRAKAAAEKALALDPQLGAAHTAMAFTLYKFSWNMREAEGAFRRAIELDPRYALAHHWFGEFLKLLGRHDESMREFRRAVELDPFSIPVRYDFILSLLSAGQTAEARALLDDSMAIDPNALRVVRASADVLFAEGRVDEAVETRLREYRIFGVPEKDVTALALAYRSGGHRRLLLTRASQLLAAMPNGPSGPTLGLSTPLAQIYADLRDREHTLLWVTKAADLGEDAPLLLKTRAFLFLQDDPRYLALLRRVGFTAEP